MSLELKKLSKHVTKANRFVLLTGAALSLIACQQTILGEQKREEVVITLHEEVRDVDKSKLPPFGPDIEGATKEEKVKKTEAIANINETADLIVGEDVAAPSRVENTPVVPSDKIEDQELTVEAQAPELAAVETTLPVSSNKEVSSALENIEQETQENIYSPIDSLSDAQLQAELEEAARLAEQQIQNREADSKTTITSDIAPDTSNIFINNAALEDLEAPQTEEETQAEIFSSEAQKIEVQEYVGEKTKIGLMLPLTSEDNGLRHVAENLRDAALLALFDQGNDTVEMVLYDTKGTRIGTTSAAEKAVSEEVDLILGPLLSESVQAAAVVARRSNIPMFSFNNRLDAAGNGVYILGNSPRFEVEDILDHAKSKGVRKIHILAPDNVYGNIVVESARGHAEMNNVKITGVDYYNSGDTDFTELTRKVSYYYGRRARLKERIKELEARNDEVAKKALKSLSKKDTLGGLPYDAILIPALNQFSLRTLTAQLSQYGVDQPRIRILGLSAWDEMGTISNEPQLVGSWYVSHPDEGWNLFARHFQKQFGYVPVNITSIAYEAVALSSLLAGRQYKPDFSDEKLHVSKGFQGVRGLFRLSRFGYAERLLAIKEITKNGVEITAPPAESFDQSF